MNVFDAAVILTVALLAVLGFRAGLLRSTADIIGFLVAAPLAVALTPYLSAAVGSQNSPAWTQNSLTFFGLLMVGGVGFAQAFRAIVAEMIGPDISIPDRLAGLLLGVARALLLAVTLVLVFDRIIPSGREPAFLQGSKFRPTLSRAAESGLRSLPPEVSNQIDRLKRERSL